MPWLKTLVPISLCALLAQGCGTSTFRPAVPASEANGRVMGGQQPVTGATVILYTVGTAGDGSAAASLLTQPVTTDAQGGFNITNLYPCANANELVYLVAVGGNPGLGGGGSNPNLALMAAVGTCAQLQSSAFIIVDEVTTVAGVAALAPYMSSYSKIGAGTTDAAGLAAAFSMAAAYANASNGTSPGSNVPAGYTVPAAEINTLADVLASCINSGGNTGSQTPCGQLFALTTPSGASIAPGDTIAALVNLANNPTLNTTSLYNLQAPQPPFQPVLTAPPATFAVALTPAITPTLQFSPSSVAFANTSVGFAAATQTVTVTNSGMATVTFGSVGLSGANVNDFTEIGSCGSTLAAGASCAFQVTATPAALGLRSASVAVPSNASGSQQTLALSVTGVAAAAGPITVSPTSLSFTIAGSLQDVTLTNNGSTTLTVGAVTSSDPTFSVASSSCGISLPPQSLCVLSILSTGFTSYNSNLFYPPASYSGTLTIKDDASGGPQTVSLSSANTRQFSVAPFSDTPVGSSTQSSFAMNAYLMGSYSFSGSVFGANAGDFSPASNGCSTGSSFPITCYFTETFTPTAGGTRVAKLGSASGYLPLSGYALGGAGVNFSVTSASSFSVFFPALTFTAYIDPATGVASGTGVLTIRNSGTTVLNISPVQLFTTTPSAFSTTGTCSTIAAGASCSVTVGLRVNSSGTANYTGTVSIQDTNSGITKTVSITATTAYRGINVTPFTIPFGNVAVGTSSAGTNVQIADSNGNPLGHAITLSTTGPFAVFPASCPASVTTLCTVAVSFAPTASGAAAGTLTATDSVSGFTSGTTLSGTGVGTPAATVSVTSLTFAARPVNSTSLPMSFTLTSSGTAALTPTISVVGAVNNNFTQTNNCPASLTTNCTISVTFAPTATGTQSATIRIVSNAASSPDTVTVSGTAQ